MTTWKNICRICSSPADYSLFDKIPTYLHAKSNEFVNWQKPINLLLEETTGLKMTQQDGLPESICALCISYLKHASTFREQTINNSMSLKAVKLLRQKNNKQNAIRDKESLLITAAELVFTDDHKVDTNLLLRNTQQDKDKVSKQLLNNVNYAVQMPTQQNIEQHMRYLNLLFDKDINWEINAKHNNETAVAALSSGVDPFAEEEFQTATSSDENDEAAAKQNHNIFSYKEKNFQEDDIMNLDALRDAITINIPESCKERKCRACFRRFMFEESYNEHMGTCIEYRFLIFIEEINRLLDIRRKKAVSPHEFIRRMIFCLRKTCEWLKENSGDILPDLGLQNGDCKLSSDKNNIESEGKSSATSSCEQTTNEKLLKFRKNIIKDIKIEPLPLLTSLTKDTSTGVFATPKPLKGSPSTPISINNNILYEIERSQSRNSNQRSSLNLMDNTELKKPVAVLAKNINGIKSTDLLGDTPNKEPKNIAERLTFIEKLQRATCQTPTHVCNKNHIKHATPQIAVRKDLLPLEHPSEMAPVIANPIVFSARCKSCNVAFETLASLEIHNAQHHNNLPTTSETPSAAPSDDEEHKRIIALFEDDNSDDF